MHTTCIFHSAGLRGPLLLLFFVLLPIIAEAGDAGTLSATQIIAFRNHLDSVRENGQYIHMIEFGGGFETSELSTHDAIISWSVVSHDVAAATSMKEEFRGSNRVSVKLVPGDYSVWGDRLQNPWDEEGSLADFESYVSEMMYFGAKDKAAFWVFNNGKAKVDVGIAALPLLSRTGGLLLVPGWIENECYSESLQQFYEVVEVVQSLAVLRPKDTSVLADRVQKDPRSHYDWCFTIVNGGKKIKQLAGPSDTGGVFHSMQREDIGCADIGGADFFCSKDKTKCASCYGVMMAISNRGHKVKQSLNKVADLDIKKSEL